MYKLISEDKSTSIPHLTELFLIDFSYFQNLVRFVVCTDVAVSPFALVSVATVGTDPVTHFDALLCFHSSALTVTLLLVRMKFVCVYNFSPYFCICINCISNISNKFI